MDDELTAIKERKRRELEKKITEEKKVTKKVRVITTDNFADIVAREKYLIIDFWAPWCGPCRMVAPVIEELAAEYDGRVTFGKCNTDENQQIAVQFGINAIPTLFFCMDGQLVHRVAGALPRSQLEHQMKTIFHI